jgi:hypothetical protein
MQKYFIFLIVVLMFSCKTKSIKNIKLHLGNTKVLTLPNIEGDDTFYANYYLNDTISTLYVSHQECTECLDAFVDSGIVFISDSVVQKILSFYKEHKILKSYKDLKLIGKTNIDEELFGNQDNFMSKWNDRFLIKGKVVDVTDGGLLFYVDSYTRIHNE